MLKLVKNSARRVSRFFGYEIVPLREMKDRDFALHLRAVLAYQHIDCILDVGANVGQYHDFLREKVLYDGPSSRSSLLVAMLIGSASERGSTTPGTSRDTH